MRRPPRASTRGARRGSAARAATGRLRGVARMAPSRAMPSSPTYLPARSGSSRTRAGVARRTSLLMPVALWSTASSTVRAASPSRMRWSRRGMDRRLRVGVPRVVGIFRRRRGRWTNVRCGEKPPAVTAGQGRGAAAAVPSGRAAEAAGPAVDLEPHLAAAIVAVDAPAARQLGEQAQAEALALHSLGIEAVPLVGDLDAREVLAQPSEEDDALIAAQAGMANRVPDDLRG